MSFYTKEDKTRLDGTIDQEDDNGRTAFRKDYGRLIHAPSFRRLQNKTQLFPCSESDFFRNRLTHSLEVAQIAGGIASSINHTIAFFKENPIDIDLVQFAGVAHDLGHPPFGHNGERALDDVMKNHGGFEGNAQTLRILSRLEKKKIVNISSLNAPHDGNIDAFGRLGINLSYRSLSSVLKYDMEIPEKRDSNVGLCKGFYQTEKYLVENIKRFVCPRWPGKTFKTIECQIMDIADDISYSTYDLEDTLKSGFLSPIEIVRLVDSDDEMVNEIISGIEKSTNNRLELIAGTPSKKITKDVIVKILFSDIFGFNLIDDSSVSPNLLIKNLQIHSMSCAYSKDGYARSALTADLVGRFMKGCKVALNEEFPVMSRVYLDYEILLQVEILKHLNYQLTIKSSRLAVVNYRGYDVVKKIFEALISEGGECLLPDDFRKLYDQCDNDSEKYRIVCDYVSGMTDSYAIEFYGRLYNGDQSIFKPF